MIDSRKFHDSVLKTGPSVAVVAGIVWALCLPYQAGAQGGFNGPGRYEITNLKSGKVLDLDRNDQTSVIQFSSRGTDNQAWEIRAAGGGFYSLRNVMNGNALEAVGTRNSTPVRATAFSGGSSQQWRFDTGKDGTALIVSRLGKTLDIPGGTSSDGARVQIYDSNGESNQQFTFRGVSGNQGGASSGNVRPNYVTPNSGAGRTQLKPGWNMFSPQQDVEVGQQVSKDAEQQIPMLKDSRVDNYLNNLGQRLSAHAPGYKFPYAYKAVNDRAINAFALPGGPVYINRGVIEAADNEAQLAGVMAHEASHVALRHGTNQASKASAAQMPLSILGGMLGSNSTGAVLAQLGAGFAVNSVLLKYSRTAETQADVMGSQILYDSGYDPRAMAQFFEKIQAQDKSGQPVAFFSSHPSPDRRTERVNEEVANLGGSQRGYNTDSREFDQIKRYAQSLPAPRPNQLQSQQQQGTPGRPDWPSDRFVSFENSLLRMNRPDNWQAYGQGDAATIAPRGGLVDDGKGNQALAYGVIVNIFEPPRVDQYGRQLQGPAQNSGTYLAEATNQLVQEFRLSNRNMRVVRSHEDIDVNNVRGLSTYLSNDSPIQGGGRETNWLITLPRPEGLLFLVFTAPERDFQSYENTFQQMLYSVRVDR
ncbi:MAG TPA: M48 family metalloprotease [Bryobacteraceae bacterium]|nr:M48 family metalloprotease [Bryobacteraceae bacterium]